MTLKREVKIGSPIRIAVLYLSGLGQLLFGIFSFPVECSGDQQCNWPSNHTAFTEKVFMNWMHLKEGFKH